MLLLGTILLIGVLIGMGFGGTATALGDVRVRWWWLIPVALGLQVLPIPRGDTGIARYLPLAAVLLSYAILVAVAVRNWRLRGFPLILLGLILNLTVIGLNQGMPVSLAAVRETGNPELIREPVVAGGKHHVAQEDDLLLPLADVIAFREPFGVVVSAGDLLIDVGGATFLAAAILGIPERSRRAPKVRPAPQAAMWGTRR